MFRTGELSGFMSLLVVLWKQFSLINVFMKNSFHILPICDTAFVENILLLGNLGQYQVSFLKFGTLGLSVRARAFEKF